MKRKADTAHLIDCLNANYGIIATTLTFLPLGEDINASIYKAETREGQSFFVKLKRGHHSDISVALLQAYR